MKARIGHGADRHLLTINVGSSSLKYDLSWLRGGEVRGRLLSGSVSHLGKRAVVEETIGALDMTRRTAAIESIDEAALLACLRAATIAEALELPIAGVVHRVVHGGREFTRATRLGKRESKALERLAVFAPLHQPQALRAIEVCARAFGPKVPQIGVFDTAFHATLPESAWRYPIARELVDPHGIRRFGFHGIAFQSVLDQLSARLERRRISAILLHLGSGCSLCAVKAGVSIDTTMGLSPLEGPLMRTRSGSLDPSLPLTLARQSRRPIESIVDALWKESGLAAVSGNDGDVRTLLARERTDARSRLALEMFVLALRKQLGAYLALLGKVDAIAFSGGVGENAHAVRQRILSGLESMGIRIDLAGNRAPLRGDGRISSPASKIPVFVVAANEADVMAKLGNEALA